MRRPLTPDGQSQRRHWNRRINFTFIWGTAIAAISGFSSYATGDTKTAFSILLFWLLLMVSSALFYAVGHLFIKVMDAGHTPPTEAEIEDAKRQLSGAAKHEDQP